MIAAMAKAPLPRFTESAINELFTARIYSFIEIAIAVLILVMLGAIACVVKVWIF